MMQEGERRMEGAKLWEGKRVTGTQNHAGTTLMDGFILPLMQRRRESAILSRKTMANHCVVS
jgi:hypothetical protein